MGTLRVNILYLFVILFYYNKYVISIGVYEQIWMEILTPQDVSYLYKLRPAKDFGSYESFKFNAVDLVLSEPEHACSKQLDNGNDIHRKIVLIKRGECSFLTKTYTAEMYGAIAVIIYDHKVDEDDEKWLDMIGDGTERNNLIGIPVFYLRGKDGQKISESIKLNSGYALVNLPVNVSSTTIPLNQPPWVLY